MTIVFDSNHLKNRLNILNNTVCHFSCQTNQVCTTLCEKVEKTNV